MKIKAKAKYIRISSRKVRLVANIIRGMKVGDALDQLKFINKKAIIPIVKLINSGIANAEHNYELDKDNLLISEIRIDEGPTLHRWMPRAHGRATPIRKRSSNISLVLSEIKDSGKVESKKQDIEAPLNWGKQPKKEVPTPASPGRDSDSHPDDSARKSKDDNIEGEKGKEISDPRMEGKGKHAKIEGGKYKGFTSKMFRRKSG